MMRNQVLNVNSLLWLALVLALAGSLKHLATIFASVDGNTLMGWVQAVAIDAGLVALAYSIRQRKAAKRSTKPLWFGVTLFTTISVYGNLAYGLMATDSLPGWIVVVKPYVLAGSLPILVLFLSELLSDDRQHMAKEAEKEQRKTAREAAKEDGNTGESSQNTFSLAGVNADKQAAKVAKKQQLAAFLEEKPDATNTELATLLDVSRGTIRNYRQELATNGDGQVVK